MLNAPRSTLSVFTTVEGYDVGKQPLVCHYMKALCYLKLTLHNYSFTWDVSIVLKYVGELTKDSVFHLSGKLAILLPVFCGHKTDKKDTEEITRLFITTSKHENLQRHIV